jgi:hypothetical protein
MFFSSKEAFQRALHCAARADEAFDESTRELFLRMRDNWVEVARLCEGEAPEAMADGEA